MKKTLKNRNRAAQDSTLINVRALKRRVESLETSRDIFRKQIAELWRRR